MTSWLDGKHVGTYAWRAMMLLLAWHCRLANAPPSSLPTVFGRVLDGMDVVRYIENVATSGSTPKEKVVIAKSGELKDAENVRDEL